MSNEQKKNEENTKQIQKQNEERKLKNDAKEA